MCCAHLHHLKGFVRNGSGQFVKASLCDGRAEEKKTRIIFYPTSRSFNQARPFHLCAHIKSISGHTTQGGQGIFETKKKFTICTFNLSSVETAIHIELLPYSKYSKARYRILEFAPLVFYQECNT